MMDAPEKSIIRRDKPHTDNVALAMNRKLLRLFSATLLPSLAILFGTIVASIAISFMIISRTCANNWGPILLIHLVQQGMGIVLSLFCFFLGTVMCWFGITGTFSIGAERGGWKLNARGSQIGVILFVGGIVLAIITLLKSISSSEWNPQQHGPAGQPAQSTSNPGISAGRTAVLSRAPTLSPYVSSMPFPPPSLPDAYSPNGVGNWPGATTSPDAPTLSQPMPH
jgi:hypothetical protein